MRRNSNDLIVHGYKVVGSAQRKARTAVLQHGSLILRASEFAPEVPGIAELTGQSLTIKQISDRFAGCLGRALLLRFAASDLTNAELQRAREISVQRFAAAEWRDRR
jgi:lipoate-protein ligase A